MIQTKMALTTCTAIAVFGLGCVAQTESRPADTESYADAADGGDTESTADEADGGDTGSANDEADGGDTGSENVTDTESETMDVDLDIAGEYLTNYGASVTITNSEWTDVTYASTFMITFFDNDETYLVAQNSAENTYNPELWSRFDWTVSDDVLYYCQSIYDGESEAVAKAADDASDPIDIESGCGGFAWSQLLPN